MWQKLNNNKNKEKSILKTLNYKLIPLQGVRSLQTEY